MELCSFSAYKIVGSQWALELRDFEGDKEDLGNVFKKNKGEAECA